MCDCNLTSEINAQSCTHQCVMFIHLCATLTAPVPVQPAHSLVKNNAIRWNITFSPLYKVHMDF